LSTQRRIVIKVGSSTLAKADGGLDREFVAALVKQVAVLCDNGWHAVLVSSGAIAAGSEALGLTLSAEDIPSLQASASVGQVQVLGMYAALFAAHDIQVGQVLLTRHDTAHRQAYLHARDTLERLLRLGVVPVVNENDTTAVDEIRFGDNDTLASVVATMVHADLVVLLTDIEGLYDADPRLNHEATLLEHVEELTDQLMSAAGGPGSPVGSGGMATKVEAAQVLMKAGIPMVICDGRRSNVVADAAAGEPVGTLFAGGDASLPARKQWIALGKRPCGDILVDDGARDALCTRGKSLLPAGVIGINGTFEVGDAVVLKGRDGVVFGRGLSSLSSADVERSRGLKTSEIASAMSDIVAKEVIHRDRLVIL